ncbi:hypothetical protein [Neobacillus sp. 204]|uniref:hypothetical protein n=1 Tax=Neobacillus sp. 204 TaxID=3383351 RepID=UPI00397C6BCA
MRFTFYAINFGKYCTEITQNPLESTMYKNMITDNIFVKKERWSYHIPILQIHVVQISNNKVSEVEVKDNYFSAPTQKGVYYYSYGVWWMDENEKNLSHSDAFYAFVLEVK